jgi:phosphoglycerol transferase MdoB-like AlkP superfamily enzyme
VDEMLGLKEPCLKFLFKAGLLSYLLLFSLVVFISFNWRPDWRFDVGHVVVSVLYVFQLYFSLLFFQRRGVPCEVQYDGMTISVHAFTYAGLLNSVAIFGLVFGHGGPPVILVYIAVSTLMFMFAVWLAKDLERVSKAESKT